MIVKDIRQNHTTSPPSLTLFLCLTQPKWVSETAYRKGSQAHNAGTEEWEGEVAPRTDQWFIVDLNRN
jgi:hypothetical protein